VGLERWQQAWVTPGQPSSAGKHPQRVGGPVGDVWGSNIFYLSTSGSSVTAGGGERRAGHAAAHKPWRGARVGAHRSGTCLPPSPSAGLPASISHSAPFIIPHLVKTMKAQAPALQPRPNVARCPDRCAPDAESPRLIPGAVAQRLRGPVNSPAAGVRTGTAATCWLPRPGPRHRSSPHCGPGRTASGPGRLAELQLVLWKYLRVLQQPPSSGRQRARGRGDTARGAGGRKAAGGEHARRFGGWNCCSPGVGRRAQPCSSLQKAAAGLGRAEPSPRQGSRGGLPT